MQQELLFEIGTEEIPAGYILPALESMKRILSEKLQTLDLTYTGIKGSATPRRFALCVEGLISRQPDRREEVFGPPKQAAFDQNNQPTKAAIGFAKSRGASVDDLKVVDTQKGAYVMLLIEKKGRDTVEILSEVLPEVVKEIPFPKSMHWGSSRTTFARPIQWLATSYGGGAVSCKIDEITSTNQTKGHRFMAPGPIEITGCQQYLESLRQAHVIADIEERRKAVIEEVERAATEAGGNILPDDELVDTVTNLVEKPHAVCGSFDERFLAIPSEVLITSMREHQKYFAVVDKDGKLLPYFVAVNNTKVKDVKLAAEGHQRVLRARLEDAFFFFKEDQHRPLAERVNDLSGVVFQQKLGTLLEKTSRITELAGYLATILQPDQLETAKRAAYLAKADLLTAMVNEFPSLQGVIGRDYALLNGEPETVAKAILEHYMPIRAGSELPPSPAGALVSMADRLDTIAGCFGIGQIPTGTTDPFGLRRLALGLLHVILDKGFAVSLSDCIDQAIQLYGDKLTENATVTKQNAIEFIKGRFVNDLTAKGIPVEAVEAVTSVSFDDVVECRRKIDALMAISKQPAFTILAAAFKRVMNIIKDNRVTNIDKKLFSEPAETKLHETLQAVSAEAQPHLDRKQYEEALAVILKMKEPVDLFFDDVMVMVDDPKVRDNRLALLAAVADLFLKVGDFSKMYALNQ